MKALKLCITFGMPMNFQGWGNIHSFQQILQSVYDPTKVMNHSSKAFTTPFLQDLITKGTKEQPDEDTYGEVWKGPKQSWCSSPSWYEKVFILLEAPPTPCYWNF